MQNLRHKHKHFVTITGTLSPQGNMLFNLPATPHLFYRYWRYTPFVLSVTQHATDLQNAIKTHLHDQQRFYELSHHTKIAQTRPHSILLTTYERSKSLTDLSAMSYPMAYMGGKHPGFYFPAFLILSPRRILAGFTAKSSGKTFYSTSSPSF